MNLYEIMFLIFFILALIILFIKLLNTLTFGNTYTWQVGVLLFASYFLAWLICFIVMMIHPTILIYITLFRLLTWLIMLNVMFMIIDVIFIMRSVADKPIEAFNAIRLGRQ